MNECPSPETVALARRLYLDGEPVRSILARTAIKTGMLQRCLDGEYPDGSGVQPARIPRRNAGVRAGQRQGGRAALVARMWRTAERQVEEIENSLMESGIALAERESNARTLAVVARTLRELAAVDDARKTSGKAAPKDRDDVSVPRNIDDLRRALAKKLDEFVAREAARVSDDAQ
jgi:hypothetical protein